MTPQKRQRLPSAVDAERAILGTMLHGQRAQIDLVQESIPLDAWYRPDHALLCRLLFRLADSGHDCTLSGVMDAILAANRTDGDPWSVYGGLEYVVSLPDHGGYDFYGGAIRSVVETWTRRRAIAALDAARERLISYTPGDDLTQPIALLRVDLDRAEAGLPVTAVEFVPFVQAVEGAIEQAEAAGLNPESGCRMGICHSCTRRKTHGAVKNLITGVVSTADNEDVQICITAPIGDVELNL